MPQRASPTRPVSPPTNLDRLRRQVRALKAEQVRLQESARVARELQFSIEDLRNQKEEIQIQNQQLAESQRLLEESRDRYADLFESAPTAFVGIDYHGVIREVNAMATALLGVHRGRLVETPLLLFVGESHRRTFLAFVRECRRGAAPRVDLVLRLRDGRRIPVELCSSSGTGLASGDVRYQVAITDLTERKHAVEVREQLRITAESEQLLRTVLETLPVGVQVLDHDGYVVMHNIASERIWGGPIPETLDWWASLVGWRPGSQTPLAADEWPAARAIARGESVLSELLLIEGFDRVRRTIRASALPLRNDEGLVNGAVVVHEDITALDATQAALRFSESKARRLVESNIIGVVFFDRQGVITDANDAFLSLTGYSHDELRAGNTSWKSVTAEHAVPRVELAVRQLQSRGSCEPFETACLRKDASVFYAVVGASMLEGGKEGVAFVLDISDRKQSEVQLRQAKEAAETANDVKDQFLSTVSHELRTPLSAVLLWSHLLRRGVLKTDAERAEALETIHHSAKAQSRLIDDLLDVSRILTGKLALEMRAESMVPVVEAAVSTMRPLASDKKITLAADLDPAAGVVKMDHSRMEQVVVNLLSNAVKFTPEGGHIDVSLRGKGSAMQLVVSDNGIGIAPDFLPHIFERFRQAEGTLTRSHGGLGLGLSITHELVEMHGGTIRAQSPGLGQGATFTVDLPIAEPTNGKSKTPEMRPASPAAAPTLHGLHVMVVEDDKDTRTALAKVLKGAGAKVTVADSAARALQQIRRKPPDVLVSDLAMPGEDGLSLIRRLREVEKSRPAASHRPKTPPRLPAIALTASVRPEDEEIALKAGFCAHLAKPPDPARLISLVAKLAGR